MWPCMHWGGFLGTQMLLLPVPPLLSSWGSYYAWLLRAHTFQMNYTKVLFQRLCLISLNPNLLFTHVFISLSSIPNAVDQTLIGIWEQAPLPCLSMKKKMKSCLFVYLWVPIKFCPHMSWTFRNLSPQDYFRRGGQQCGLSLVRATFLIT